VTASDYSLYIVRCADGTLYTGIAVDVERRIREHESSARGAKYLRGRGPLNLEFSECLGDRARAQKLEYRVKQLERDRKEALIAGQSSLAELLPD
jgi:putative endonuclease